MRVNISTITNAINKIADITSGDKTIPGVRLNLMSGKLDICYASNTKSMIETISVENDEDDKLGAVAVEFSDIQRAISICQPNNTIKVNDIVFKYTDKTIDISADQYFENKDAEGNITEKKLASNLTKIKYSEITEDDRKLSILNRMNYDSIFESDTTPDEFDRVELISALKKTSTEAGKLIYFSVKAHSIFVANTAYLTTVPISKIGDISLEEQDTIRAELTEAGTFTEEYFSEAVRQRVNRMHYSICINQAISKILIGILGRISAEKVYIHTNDKTCNLYVDTDTERVGVWFVMGQAVKTHLGTLERYNSLKYSTSQAVFFRDFLANIIKNATTSLKSDRINMKFIQDEEGIKLILDDASGSGLNKYYVLAESVDFDENNNILDRTFSVSLKVLSDMIEQLKTVRVALDLDCAVNGVTHIRLSEFNDDNMRNIYNSMREATAQRLSKTVSDINNEGIRTPFDIKIAFRDYVIDTKQYAILAK